MVRVSAPPKPQTSGSGRPPLRRGLTSGQGNTGEPATVGVTAAE